ncbi:hypothetical protein C8R43DRAFT_965477 [Mycena crocata]|nr:hypothetical protein C8R43DRAFT_965477 [Mycena crocata]
MRPHQSTREACLPLLELERLSRETIGSEFDVRHAHHWTRERQYERLSIELERLSRETIGSEFDVRHAHHWIRERQYERLSIELERLSRETIGSEFDVRHAHHWTRERQYERLSIGEHQPVSTSAHAAGSPTNIRQAHQYYPDFPSINYSGLTNPRSAYEKTTERISTAGGRHGEYSGHGDGRALHSAYFGSGGSAVERESGGICDGGISWHGERNSTPLDLRLAIAPLSPPAVFEPVPSRTSVILVSSDERRRPTY